MTDGKAFSTWCSGCARASSEHHMSKRQVIWQWLKRKWWITMRCDAMRRKQREQRLKALCTDWQQWWTISTKISFHVSKRNESKSLLHHCDLRASKNTKIHRHVTEFYFIVSIFIFCHCEKKKTIEWQKQTRFCLQKEMNTRNCVQVIAYSDGIAMAFDCIQRDRTQVYERHFYWFMIQ